LTDLKLGRAHSKKEDFLALKGRNIPAQDNALGKHYNDLSPERATYKITIIKASPLFNALTGLKVFLYLPGALPWAVILCPFRAKRYDPFFKCAQLGVINENSFI